MKEIMPYMYPLGLEIEKSIPLTKNRLFTSLKDIIAKQWYQ